MRSERTFEAEWGDDRIDVYIKNRTVELKTFTGAELQNNGEGVRKKGQKFESVFTGIRVSDDGYRRKHILYNDLETGYFLDVRSYTNCLRASFY